ncbi:MAG: DUF996 domain-containing protein [Thaumarchaeota archaeon]|nr:DUF996 domain-containing protein [Nitrososphaerota archaeon]
MASLAQAKTLGGVGALLVLFTAIPSVGWALGVAGFVMILLAVKYISEVVRDSGIYNNMILSVILAIGAIAVGTVTVIGTVFRVLGMGTFVGPNFVIAPNIGVGDWLGLAAAVIVGLAVVWGLLIASAVFLRRSLNSISSRLNVKMFETTGLLYLIGAATAIIAIGFLLILVAEILLVVSFFSINEQQKVPEASQAQNIPASS